MKKEYFRFAEVAFISVLLAMHLFCSKNILKEFLIKILAFDFDPHLARSSHLEAIIIGSFLGLVVGWFIKVSELAVAREDY